MSRRQQQAGNVTVCADSGAWQRCAGHVLASQAGYLRVSGTRWGSWQARGLRLNPHSSTQVTGIIRTLSMSFKRAVGSRCVGMGEWARTDGQDCAREHAGSAEPRGCAAAGRLIPDGQRVLGPASCHQPASECRARARLANDLPPGCRRHVNTDPGVASASTQAPSSWTATAARPASACRYTSIHPASAPPGLAQPHARKQRRKQPKAPGQPDYEMRRPRAGARRAVAQCPGGRSWHRTGSFFPGQWSAPAVPSGAGAVVEVGGEGGVAASAHFPAQRRVG